LFGDDASKDPETALTRSIDLFLDGEVDPSTRQTLKAQLGDLQTVRASPGQVNEGLLAGLVLGTPEFQRR